MSTNGSPTMTVVVPLHNGEQFIVATLDSLAGQTVPLPEVVVVDDGSTDAGPELVASHPLALRLIRQEQAGVAVARNRGALAASSRYVAFLDQDDLWLPWRHERLLAFLEQTPECRALATTERAFFLRRDRAALEELGEGLHHGATVREVVDVAALLAEATPAGGQPAVARRVSTRDLLQAPIAVTVSYVFERELLLAAGGCPTLARSIDDYLAVLAVSRFTDIPLLDEPSVLYRIHPASAAMSTSWPLPLLTALTAVRYGGTLVPRGREREMNEVGRLDRFWQHQLLELARCRLQGLFDALALVRLLGTSAGERRSLSRQLVKAYVSSRLRG